MWPFDQITAWINKNPQSRDARTLERIQRADGESAYLFRRAAMFDSSAQDHTAPTDVANNLATEAKNTLEQAKHLEARVEEARAQVESNARETWLRQSLESKIPGKTAAARAHRNELAHTLRGPIEAHAADMLARGEQLSEARIASLVETLSKTPLDDLRTISEDDIRGILRGGPEAPPRANMVNKADIAKRQASRQLKRQKADLLREANLEINRLASEHAVHELQKAGPQLPETLNSTLVETAGKTDPRAGFAKRDIAAMLEQHFADPSHAATPISEESVRKIAAMHYDAHVVGTGALTPIEQLLAEARTPIRQPNPTRVIHNTTTRAESTIDDVLSPSEKAARKRKIVHELAATDPNLPRLSPEAQKLQEMAQRDVRLTTSLGQEAGAFFTLENTVVAAAHTPLNQLTPVQLEARVRYLNHPEAVPELKEFLVTAASTPEQGGNMLQRLWRRMFQKPTEVVGPNGQSLLVDGAPVLEEFDGTLRQGSRILQEGSAPATIEARLARAAETAAPVIEHAPNQGRAGAILEETGPAIKKAGGVAGKVALIAGAAAIAAPIALSALFSNPTPRRPSVRDEGDDAMRILANPDIRHGTSLTRSHMRENWASQLKSEGVSSTADILRDIR